MHYIYLLRSQTNVRKLYIGYTNDLERRLAEHNRATNGHTAKFKPWEMIYYEAYRTQSLAIEREWQLKRHANTTIQLKKRLRL